MHNFSNISSCVFLFMHFRLLETISSLGPAIIKGGQALASRSDLMPSEYLEELQKLQDDVPRFDNTRAFATVEKELNITFEDVFELINNDPIAAARWVIFASFHLY